MSGSFEVIPGAPGSRVILHVPHSSRAIPDDVRAGIVLDDAALEDELDAITDGFHFIQLLRLRSQHLDTEHDSPGDNKIDPDTLNELDRRILKEAFRQARKLQLRLKLDYQL